MELLCFDLDNTLIKSTKAHIKAFKKSFTKNQLPKRTEKEILRYFSLESSQLVRILYPELQEKRIAQVVHDHDDILIHETAKKVKAIPEARTTLKKLKKSYKIAILSNCKKKEIIALLKHAQIKKELFTIIIGNDQVKHPKPAPDEIIKAEQMLKIKKGYMIGDSIYDIRAGKRAKVKTIAVCTGNHTKKELEKENPWEIIKSLKDLPHILKKDINLK